MLLQVQRSEACRLDKLKGSFLSVWSTGWFGFLCLMMLLPTQVQAGSFSAKSIQPYLEAPSARRLRKALRRANCGVAEKHFRGLRKGWSKEQRRGARLLLGLCSMQARTFPKARTWFLPLTQKSYILWDYVILWVGDTYKEESNTQAAVKAYLKVPARSLLYPEARLRAAQMLLEAGKAKQALQSIQRMPGKTTRSSHWWVAAQAARALKTRRGRKEATRWAARIWVKAPVSPEADNVKKWMRRRRIRMRLSKAQRIQRAMKLNRHFQYRETFRTLRGLRLSRKAPKSLRCHLQYALGFAWFRRRRYRRATRYLLRARRACRGDKRLDIRSLYYLGHAYRRRGLWRTASPILRELARRFPSHYLADDAIFMIADSADRRGLKRMAKSHYSELMRRFPKGDMSRSARWRLAYQAYRYRKWKQAKKRFKAIYVKFPKDKYAPAALYYAAKVQAAMGRRRRRNRRKVIKLYTKLVRSYPLHYYSFLALTQLRRLQRKRWRLRRCKWKQTDQGLTCVEIKTKKKRWFKKLPWGPVPLRPPTPKELVQLYNGYSAPFLSHPSYLRGRELLRLGRNVDAVSEFLRLRTCKILKTTKKYRRCGKRGDKGAELLALLFHQAGLYYLADSVFRGRGIIAGRAPFQASTLRSWYLGYPRPFWPIAKRASKRDKVPWPIAYGIMREESTFRPDILSRSNAYGLMQMLVSTARMEARSLRWRRRLRPNELFLPSINISLGIRHLRRLSRRFKGQVPLMAGAYNAGAGRVKKWLKRRGKYPYDKWVEAIGIKQTRHYVRRVSQSYSIYNFLYPSRRQKYWGRIPFTPYKRPRR